MYSAGKPGSGNARTGGKGKHVKVAQRQTLDELEGIFKLFFALAGKSGQHVGADCRFGEIGMDLCDEFSVILRAIGPVHSGQDFRVGALQGNMEVTANPGG